jgi:hypothetical protein
MIHLEQERLWQQQKIRLVFELSGSSWGSCLSAFEWLIKEANKYFTL